MKFLLATFCVVILFSCKQKFDNKTYEENKVSLAQRENDNPQQFLKLSSDDKKNIFGATVIKGKIVNTASVHLLNALLTMYARRPIFVIFCYMGMLTLLTQMPVIRNFIISPIL